MKEFNIEELEKISAGKLTTECNQWLKRNKATIMQRLEKNKNYGQALVLIADANWGEKIYSVEVFKEKIKEIGIDCDDLN